MSRRKNGVPRPLGSRRAWLLVAPATIAVALLLGAPASAASLTGPLSGWQKGTEPTWVSMYEYVPNSLAANAPILVLVHYCGGTAAGVLGEAQGGGIVAAADKYGFIIVLPQTSQNCWDVATTPSLTHNGGGDTGAIVDQVKYSISKHNANANRVYVNGTSSGAMMAEGLLAVYPDVFKGGAEFAGVPAGCWSVSDPNGQWSGPCAGGMVTHTAADWGTMVRNMYPGYSGFRPRVQLWHGEADSIISYTNQTEAIKEWTNVLGLATNPTSTTTVTFSNHQYTRQQWQDSCGLTLLDAWSEINGPHGTDANLNATYTVPFLALDQSGATDPQVAGCSTSGSGGGSGTGGTAGTSGTSGRGGATGAGGRGGTTGTAGTVGTAGTSGTAGTAGAAGINGASGTTGTSTGTAGSGASGVAGDSGGGGATGTSTGTGNNSGTGGDTTGSAGDTGTSGQGNSGAGPGDIGPSRPGCACNVTRGSGALDTFALAGVVAVVLRRRRAKR